MPWHDEVSDLITPGLDPGVFFGGNEEDAMVKPWHDEVLEAITPGLDPGVFFRGNDEDAMA